MCSDLADNSEIVIKIYAYGKHPFGSYNCEQDMRNDLNASHDQLCYATNSLKVHSGYLVIHLKLSKPRR